MTEDLHRRVQELLKRVAFPGYTFICRPVGSIVVLFAQYDEADLHHGKVETQTTRRWTLAEVMTDSEIVQTAFKCCLTSMEHRTREQFRYRGQRIFGPHFNVEDLVGLCDRGRDDAGGRIPAGG